VVVNTVDRAKSVRTLLRALEHQTYPHFEVVVVVGPTEDETLQVLSEYSPRIRLLRCPEANLSQSRNVGLLGACGDVVVYIDDDAVPSRRWLEQLAYYFRNPLYDGVGGMVYQHDPKHNGILYRLGTVSSLGDQFLVRSSYVDKVVPGAEQHGRQWAARLTGGNMAFRRQALLDVGGFDEFYIWVAEETDLCLRMVNNGAVIHPIAEASVHHLPASSRNRVVFTSKGRWWLGTRSLIYYAFKNGLSANDSIEKIARISLERLHGHWLWYRQLMSDGHLKPWEIVWKCSEDIWAGAVGTYCGLVGKRKLIPAEKIQEAEKRGESILPFLSENSRTQPSVDPVTGNQPHISMPDEPLRICLASSEYPPNQYGGVGRLTQLMAQGLFACGHSVHVITRGARDHVSFYDGAFVYETPCPLERYSQYQHLPNLYHTLNYSHAVHKKVQRLVINEGIQLLDSPLWQVNGLITSVSGLLPVAVRLVTSIRQINDIQRDWSEDQRLIGDLEEELLRHSAYLLPNSQATLDTIRGLFSFDQQNPEPPVKNIPYGIVPVPDEDVRLFSLDNPPPTLTVLYLGRLEKRKGTPQLLEAIPRVLDAVGDVRFILAGGDNSLHDGFQAQTGQTYADYFARKYAQYTDRVSFLGKIDDEQLNVLYQSCDLFVAPSLYESFGIVYLEAMNYGKPVVGCKSGGVPEVVDDGVTGILVEPSAIAPLAEAIIDLLRSPQRLYDLGAAGRARLMEKFTYLQMARNFASVYRTMIAQFATTEKHKK